MVGAAARRYCGRIGHQCRSARGAEAGADPVAEASVPAGASPPAKSPKATRHALEDLAGAVVPANGDRGSAHTRRDDGAFPTRGFDQTSASKGGQGPMKWAGRHIVPLRQLSDSMPDQQGGGRVGTIHRS